MDQPRPLKIHPYFDPEQRKLMRRPSGVAIRIEPPGLGDRLQRLLKPFVKRWDAIWGTNLARCAACARRQTRLNHLEARLKRLWRQTLDWIRDGN